MPESIKARFAKLGYVEEDVSCIRWHREVSTSKPMSDRGTPTLPWYRSTNAYRM